eukprot:TRINITY_DN25811_c0_g1_i1.p1 TRINITY_DN25811_c0_g1~~TRINITY_DN25811_c0_g1_i1.p1  ORF type:complete len:508 (+),score=126.07 TRINITY_DN25811_c0_g1_i1:156-1679(+)
MDRPENLRSSAARIRRELSTPQTLNPFMNNTSSGSFSLYESMKLVMGVVVVPLRLSLVIAGLGVGWIFAKLSTLGLTKEQLDTEPIAPWRRWILSPLPWIVRGVLAVCGFYWVNVKGKPAPASEAPLVCPNHVSYFDALFFSYHLGGPVGVAKSGVGKMPIVGPLLMCMQPILVYRGSPELRARAARTITERATSRRWPHILIFPEGTCTNGRALITFKNGPFYPGVPVQPVVIRYPHVHCDVSWSGEKGLGFLLYHSLCQFVNYMEVEYLPVYTPSEQEKQNPSLFASNVRREMATALQVPATDHSLVDVMLSVEALKRNLPLETGVVRGEQLTAEFGKSANLDTLKSQMEKFARADRDGSGTVSFTEFCAALELPESELVREVFTLMDLDETGELDFREYAIGTAFVHKYLGTDETLQFAFNLFDVNKDGQIDAPEFLQVMRKAFPEMTEESASSIFKSVDGDGNSQISFEEFRAFMEKHPEYLSLVAKFNMPPPPVEEDASKTE